MPVPLHYQTTLGDEEWEVSSIEVDESMTLKDLKKLLIEYNEWGDAAKVSFYRNGTKRSQKKGMALTAKISEVTKENTEHNPFIVIVSQPMNAPTSFCNQQQESGDRFEEEIEEFRRRFIEQENINRELTRRFIENIANESKAVSYSEYYDDKNREGRVESLSLYDEISGVSEQELPEFLSEASKNIGTETTAVKPFWQKVLRDNVLLKGWKNGYEAGHLGTKTPDISIYPPDVEKPSANDFVSVGDCKGNTWSGISHTEVGQIMLYLHRMFDAQPTRQFGYGFVTNNALFVLVKAYRSTTSPYMIRWCVSNPLTFENGMKVWLLMMQKDTGYHPKPTIQGYPVNIQRTLRPGGTCRAFEATYRGNPVVAKLYEKDEHATESDMRTKEAHNIVARHSHVQWTSATVPQVIATEGKWSLISPKGTPLVRENITKIHVQQLLRTLQVVHQADIIHRDVRVSNILFLSKTKVLLNDWGSSVSKSVLTMYAGAPKPHVHPEIPLDGSYYNPSAHHDLYSLVSSLAHLFLPGVTEKARHQILKFAFDAAEICDYDGVSENITKYMH
eukprot:CAMPEP_0118677524 /NCGR_PEP_ID=MMETSP0800-20121206/2678_1 /TAXON_ID=210618 ORGANISM="Striatella unipunctata, Strain CCMP2910" /NCGR_SAMPLE_ID=MMETSP0800 /ASSEMBLY_ACC=CAM_ASM_000638 /LENGTH=560 /DNA_ID=CAMNT_0006573213 /DNA_START=222 /DNA_END=1905 /DNA_ORIENTATION=+